MKHHGQRHLNLKDPILAVAIIALIVSMVPDFAPVATVSGIVYLALFSYLFGRAACPDMRADLASVAGVIALSAYYAVAGSLALATIGLTPAVLTTLHLVSGLSLIILTARRQHGFAMRLPLLSATPLVHALRIILLGASTALLFFIFSARTFDSAQALWPILPTIVFTLFFLVALAYVTLAIRDHRATWLFVVPLYVAACGAAIFVFPLGYGFDPFIHQAAERIILNTGTLSPFPWYYAGYYSLVLSLQSLIQSSYEAVDNYLTLVTAATVLPGALFASFRYVLQERRSAMLAPLLFLMLPFSELVQPTPQALSFMALMLTILVSLPTYYGRHISRWPTGAGALAALVLHPLTGIFAVIYALLCAVATRHALLPRRRLPLIWFIAIAGAGVLPIGLYLAASISPDFSAQIAAPDFALLASLFDPAVYRFTRLDDLIYSFPTAVHALYLAIALYGLHRLRASATSSVGTALALMTGSALIASLITAVVLRLDLPSSEQLIFATRALRVSAYFSFPLFLCGTAALVNRALQRRPPVIMIVAIALSAAVTLSWYLSYPRFDSREQNKGFTASLSDIEAIHWIDSSAAGDYVVLANQTVSAVAVKELGFAHYYNGMLFYPLPTNGPLYQLYEQAMDNDADPSAVIQATRGLTGVQQVYLVINHYWSNSSAIVQRYTEAATANHEVDNAVTILFFE